MVLRDVRRIGTNDLFVNVKQIKKKKKSFLTDSNAAIDRLRNSEISRIEWHARKRTSMYSVYTNNIINVHVRDYISGKIGFAIER